MSTVIFIIAVILIVVGFIGSVVPGVPGSPLYLVAMLLARFFADAPISNVELIVYAVLVILSIAADFIAPVYVTKLFGGSKAGMWGSVIGLLASPFIPIPTFGFGIIIWPFLGAVLGELIVAKKETSAALKSGIGNLIGFLLTTLFKIFLGIWAVLRVCSEWIDSDSGLIATITEWINNLFK